MASRSRSQLRVLPWLILGPLLVVAGVFLGRAYRELTGRANARVWTDPTSRKPMSVLRDGAMLPAMTVTWGEVGKPSTN